MFLSPRRTGDRYQPRRFNPLPVVSSFVFQPVKRTAVKTCFLVPLSSSLIPRYARTNVPTAQPESTLPVIATPHGRGARGPGASLSLVKNWPETIQRTARSFLRSLFLPRLPSFLPSFLSLLSRWCVSLVTGNVATNELKRNFEEGRKRCHFHPRYSTISSDMEDLRDGSRNRLWSGNVTPLPPPFYAPYISSSCTFPFYGEGAEGGDGGTKRSDYRKKTWIPSSPSSAPFSQFSPNVFPRFFSKYLLLATPYRRKETDFFFRYRRYGKG